MEMRGLGVIHCDLMATGCVVFQYLVIHLPDLARATSAFICHEGANLLLFKEDIFGAYQRSQKGILELPKKPNSTGRSLRRIFCTQVKHRDRTF
jgi:hypothetical protein